jgi:hypothetical protein
MAFENEEILEIASHDKVCCEKLKELQKKLDILYEKNKELKVHSQLQLKVYENLEKRDKQLTNDYFLFRKRYLEKVKDFSILGEKYYEVLRRVNEKEQIINLNKDFKRSLEVNFFLYILLFLSMLFNLYQLTRKSEKTKE